MESKKHIVILYTTLYREGGADFEKAAKTLAKEKAQLHPDFAITCQKVESKREFKYVIKKISDTEEEIAELQFIGHSGMYGIMFGTESYPEQFSPFEWKEMHIPFTKDAKAYFHACRTARWFAPFFARTFKVKAYGYFWYTTVSKKPNRYAWNISLSKNDGAYIISTIGKKSHGVLGSFKKHMLAHNPYPMMEFLPTNEEVDTTYDSVANLYDQTFEDISVRHDELSWLKKQISQIKNPKVLDIGCGTGAFTRALADHAAEVHGVDLSAGMLKHAVVRSVGNSKLHYKKINGPELPYPDNTFDVVTSVLSFRYLDWDPIVLEILRVLKPGGRLMIIDMVAAPVKMTELPKFAFDRFRRVKLEKKQQKFHSALNKMVNDERWKKMLEYNPMRAEHEFKWYLDSRFPGGEMNTLNYAYRSRILAFCSPPIHIKSVPRLTYP